MVKEHSPIQVVRKRGNVDDSIPKPPPPPPSTDRDDAPTSPTKKKKVQSPLIVTPKKICKKSQESTLVRFSTVVSVKGTLHMNDMSEEVREQYWLTEDDQEDIKDDCRAIIFMMMRNEVEEGCCTRGLEFRTRSGQKKKQKNKETVRSAVLFQQDIQRLEGIVDPEFIAAVSMSKSKESAENAFLMAQNDRSAILDYVEGYD